MSDLQDLPLPALFRRAEATFQKLQAQQTPPISPSTQTQLINDALASLDRASLLVESLGLFSSNEDKDDLTTSEIKYLLIPYYKAEFLTQQHQNYISNRLSNTTESSGPTSGGDASVLNHQKLRLEALNSVPPLLENFLLQAQQYDLLSPGTLKCLSAVVGSGGKTPKIDASTLRELKIEKFKLEKSISARMEALLHRLGKSSINEEDNDDDDDSELAERELQILKIESAALKSIEALRAVRQEIEVLHHATNLSDEDRRRSTLSSSSQNSQHSNGDTQDLLAELRKAAGALKLGQDAVQRESLRQAVFQPTHFLPTLTVEQQGDIEVAQILAQQRAEAEKTQRIAAEKAARGRKADDSEEDDEYEDKIYKQRAMDDWKDENPRGWGNSKLKPCG